MHCFHSNPVCLCFHEPLAQTKLTSCACNMHVCMHACMLLCLYPHKHRCRTCFTVLLEVTLVNTSGVLRKYKKNLNVNFPLIATELEAI